MDALAQAAAGGSADYATPADWIEANFFIPETPDHHLILAPYQRATLNEALRTGEDGKFVYSTVVWSDIKKSIKSTVAAAVVQYRAFRSTYGSFYIVANDLKQADSRVAYYLRRSLELNSAYGKRAKVTPSGYTVELDNHTRIEAIPVDPKGEAGANPDGVFYSELWGANQKAALRMWTETTLSPTKYGYSQRWVETYAGFSGESPLLEQLYESGVRQGRRLDLSDDDHDLSDLELYANDAARLLCLWNTRPRLNWQTPEYYAQESAVLTPDEFRRVHRNEWVSSEAAFINVAWWDQCQRDLTPLRPRQGLVIGIDGAVTQDSFALVAVSRTGGVCEVRYVQVYEPPLGGKIDLREPEAELRRLVKTYNCVELAYDPTQMEGMMQRFNFEGIVHCEPFQQTADRLEADKQLYDRILAQTIIHDGDPTLRSHLMNANAKIDPEGHKLRITHRAPHLRMDASVALSMACKRASYLQIG